MWTVRITDQFRLSSLLNYRSVAGDWSATVKNCFGQIRFKPFADSNRCQVQSAAQKLKFTLYRFLAKTPFLKAANPSSCPKVFPAQGVRSKALGLSHVVRQSPSIFCFANRLDPFELNVLYPAKISLSELNSPGNQIPRADSIFTGRDFASRLRSTSPQSSTRWVCDSPKLAPDYKRFSCPWLGPDLASCLN